MGRQTHDGLNIGVGPQLLDQGARVAFDAGAGAVEDGDGDVPPDEAHPLAHGSLCPAVRNGHVLEGALPAGREKHLPLTANSPPVKGWWYHFKRHTIRLTVYMLPLHYNFTASGGGWPWGLGIQVVDVLRDGVVLEHGGEFLLKIRSECLYQSGPWASITDTETLHAAWGQVVIHTHHRACAVTEGSRQSQACKWVEGAQHGPKCPDPHGNGPVLLRRFRPLRKTPRFNKYEVCHPAGQRAARTDN